MYIPTSFYSNPNSSPITASGGTTGTFSSGSVTWKYHMFTGGSGSFVVEDGFDKNAKLLVVGAGGDGGTSNYFLFSVQPFAGGGGGGGVVYYDNFTLVPRTYDLYVGTGSITSDGQSSWINIGRNISDDSQYSNATFIAKSNSITAFGGGKGAYTVNQTTFAGAGYGGSGGGGYARNSGGGGGVRGQGNGGGSVTNRVSPPIYRTGAGGGGALSSGGGAVEGLSLSATTVGGGGEGIPLFVTGGLAYYGCGGPGLKEPGNLGTKPTGYGSNYSSDRPPGRGGFGNYQISSGAPVFQSSTSGVIVIVYATTPVYGTRWRTAKGSGSPACSYSYINPHGQVISGTLPYGNASLVACVKDGTTPTGCSWTNLGTVCQG